MRLLACVLFLMTALLAQKPQTDQIQTAAGAVKITPIHHASLMLEGGGMVIHVDPTNPGYEGLPKADIILITHSHFDHMEPALVAKLSKPGTVILAPEDVARQVSGATVLHNGESKQVGKWTIDAVPMYNLKRGPAAGKLYHTKGAGNGYILTYGGKRFYIAGDTEGVPEMRALKNIDVAFVCMNLPYTMPPDEAADAVKAFHPKIVYPYHYRGSDLSVFQKALDGTGIEVRLREWYPPEAK